MKKKILKNVVILTFALFGLGIIGNNVILAKDTIIEDPGDGGGGSTIKYCYTSYMAGVGSVVPCINFSNNTLPRYECGTRMRFTWPSGNREQCY